MLKPIESKDLIFSGGVEDDRTNTSVTLEDYDWMEYKVVTKFNTKEQGVLQVDITYFGMTICQMTVNQALNGENKVYVYDFPTEIFKENIRAFLTAHMNAWDEKYAFNGEEYVINFFNQILKEGKLVEEESD